jgi:uncharacterized protein (DUF885 family)
MSDFGTVRVTWWEGWARAFPEDATSLGIAGHGHRLRDDDGPAGERELAFHRALLPELAALARETLTEDERLDVDSMLRVSRFRAHALDSLDHDRRSLELSLYPHAMLGHQLAHAASPADLAEVEERLARVPAALSARAAALGEGLARGHAADRETLDATTSYGLDGAERWYRELDVTLSARGLSSSPTFFIAARAAADATRAHRTFLERELSGTADDTAALGEAEYASRLALFYGEPIDPAALAREAQDDIARLGAQLVELAARAAEPRGARIDTVSDALAYVGWLFGEHPATPTEILRCYREEVARARDWVVERGLFTIPERELGVVPIPPGMVHGGSATNWPAPLADRSRRGHLALSLDPAAHASAFVRNLAVHEAIPGHFLQSVAWQERYGDDEAPVRFVAVNDDVASASGYFGAMPNIEGFAVHCEVLLFDHGFYDGDPAVAAVASALIRAARVVADVALHTRAEDRVSIARALSASTGMPKRWCENAVLRFARIPVQATAYFVGAKKIRALYDTAAGRESFDAARFHDALFALGPATPVSMRPLL